MYAIDLFCGAGGFSEGILQAGFHIVFSSDKSPHVRETYMSRHEQLGLNQGENTYFELADIEELEGKSILKKVNNLNYFLDREKKFDVGDIDVIFGGPPCQGFSIAGKRDKKDPRNMLFAEYLRVVRELMPKYVVIENVEGFLSMQVNPNFKSFKKGYKYADDELVSVVVKKELEYIGYEVLEPKRLDASDFGVPQRRNRVIVLASRKDVSKIEYPTPTTPNPEDKVTIKEALSSITIDGISKYSIESITGRTPHFITRKPINSHEKLYNTEESSHQLFIEERFSLFKEGENIRNVKERILANRGTKNALDLNNYPNLLIETLLNINEDDNISKLSLYLKKNQIEISDSNLKKINRQIKKMFTDNILNNDGEVQLRISKNKDLKSIESKDFIVFLKSHLNKKVSKSQLVEWFKNKESIIDGFKEEEILNYIMTNKNTRKRLELNKPGPTMVTLPDDYIHPLLNKVLNVREMARIQSFDDSFIFRGKRTTGGTNRKHEVPQFTQVGNAVPPLLAFAIANEVRKAINTSES